MVYHMIDRRRSGFLWLLISSDPIGHAGNNLCVSASEFKTYWFLVCFTFNFLCGEPWSPHIIFLASTVFHQGSSSTWPQSSLRNVPIPPRHTNIGNLCISCQSPSSARYMSTTSSISHWCPSQTTDRMTYGSTHVSWLVMQRLATQSTLLSVVLLHRKGWDCIQF